ncbi:hypothetical protein NM208_g8962 [Fusarium decemcellulare]|uniref:Uncharacterized protein n=1 Tax=Fusarium decemcellulare TaxID=57161 RepID=A0ACC1S3D6_9HYPO|nr:hypothetical protein NM208_g8962 [Fusarium decemcellulare]
MCYMHISWATPRYALSPTAISGYLEIVDSRGRPCALVLPLNPYCPVCDHLDWEMTAQKRWDPTLKAQKGRLGEYLNEVDLGLNRDTFDIYLKDLGQQHGRRSIMKALQPTVLEQIKSFTAGIISITQGESYAAMAWGVIAYALRSVTDKVAEMLSNITKHLPVIEEYKDLFPDCEKLNEPMGELYDEYVGFCTDAVLFFKMRMWKILFKIVFGSLRKRFHERDTNITRHSETFMMHVDLVRTQLQRDTARGVKRLVSNPDQTVVKGIPWEKNPQFYGRDNVLEDIHGNLRPKDDAQAKGQLSCVIHGIGGVGKTQLALEYTYRYRSHYKYIFWIFWLLGKAVMTKAARSSLSETRWPTVSTQVIHDNMQRLITTDPSWLLVFDNVDQSEPELDFLHPSKHFDFNFVCKSLTDHNLVITTPVGKQRRLSIHRALKKYLLQCLEDRSHAKLQAVFWQSLKMEPKIKPVLAFATLLLDTANYLWEKGLTKEGMETMQIGEEVCVQFSNIPEKCDLALELRKRRIQQLEQSGHVASDNAILLANAWNDVSVVRIQNEEFKEAVPCLKESLRLKNKWELEDNIPWHFSETYKNLAFTHLSRGEFKKAREFTNRSYNLYSRSIAEKSAATQKAKFILATILLNYGDIEEALKLHKKILLARQEIFSKAPGLTKDSLYNVGEIYRQQGGKLEKAEAKFREALEDYKAWPPEAIARAQYHLALVINKFTNRLTFSRKIEAAQLEEEARQLRERLDPSSVSNTPKANLRLHDFMVSLWARRTSLVKKI